MDNQEKMATQRTQDYEKHNTICVGHTNNVNKDTSPPTNNWR